MADTIVRVVNGGQTYDLEILDDIPLRLNISATEVGEVGDLFGVGSQTFTLPGNDTTNKFFNHAYNIGTSDVPAFYNTVPAYIIYKGQTLLRGQFMLIDVTTDNDGYVSYNCQITDDVVQLKDNLANQFIAQADWSAYNHTISSASVMESWNGDLLSGSVYYPVAEYGDEDEDVTLNKIGFANGGSGQFFDKSSTPLLAQQLIPAIRARDTLEVIINQIGFRPTGSFFDSPDFEDVYILPKAKQGVGFNADPTSTATFRAVPGYPIGIDLSQYVNQFVTVPFTQEQFDYENKYNDTDSYYTMAGLGNYVFEMNTQVFNPLSGIFQVQAGVDLNFKLMVGTAPKASNGYVGNGAVINEETYSAHSSGSFLGQSINLGADFYNSTPGTEVWIWLYTTVTQGSLNSANQLMYNGGNFECTQAPISYEGSTVEMALQWPSDLRSIDVVDSLIKQFNLVFTPSNTSDNVIEVDTFDNWMLQGRNVDWTDRFNTAERVTISHTVDDVERELIYKNADDVDRFSKTTIENEPGDQYGTLRLLADNNISQGQRTIETKTAPVILAASFLSGSVDTEGNPTYNVDLNSRFVVPHLYKFENNRISSFKFKPRIGYKVTNQAPAGTSWYFGVPGENPQELTEYTTISNVNSLPVQSTTKDLHFNNSYGTFSQAGLNLNSGKNAYNNYWEILTDSLYWDDSRKVTLDLKFSPNDYQDIKLNDHIFIKDTQYRINKISGYNLNGSDLTTVELVKLYPAYVTPAIVPDCNFTLSGSYSPSACAPVPVPAPTSTPQPQPVPFATPVPVATLNDGWHFEAEATPAFSGSTFSLIGYHQGTLFGCPSILDIGTGLSPTTATTSLPGVDCYSGGFGLVTKGKGLNGIGTQSNVALTQFTFDNSVSSTQPWYIGLKSISPNSNLGSGTLSGNIYGSDGSSGTFTVNYTALVTYVDNDGNGTTIVPESNGNMTVTGISSLVAGVSYTIEI